MMENNGDIIRKMSNEELAELLADVADWSYAVDFGSNAEAWFSWLNKEAVE